MRKLRPNIHSLTSDMMKQTVTCLLALIVVALASPNIRKKREDFDNEFTKGSKKILKAYKLYDKKMVRDDSVSPTTETIKWRQWEKCGAWDNPLGDCSEEYLLVDYYQDGDKSNPVMKVFVAKSVLSPPDHFSTDGYDDYLHFGFLFFGGQNQAIFFVLHPNKWGPYQKRFKTNTFTKFFNKELEKIAKKEAKKVGKDVGEKVAGAALDALADGAVGEVGADIGAAIGSIVPGAGTILGGLLGAAAGDLASDLADDLFGDYLRYIG